VEKSQIEAACLAIRNGRSAIILVHQNPDADTLGSALALARAFRFLRKEVTIVSEDEVPDTYDFLPDIETIIRETTRRDFDIGIACDIQEPFRVGKSKDPLYSTQVMITIDHHPALVPVSPADAASPATIGAGKPVESVPEYAGQRILLLDPTAAATAEIVIELVDSLAVPVDQEMAEQLMAALVGDTGGFRFPNATPRTFELAARLTRHGASASEAARHIYETRSFISTAILGRALASIESDPDGCVFWGKVTREDYRALGATDADTESIVNFIRMTKGALVGILFREIDENAVRVSLRSQPGIDVRRIAAVFGGGGHACAAGCTVDRPLDEAIRLVVDEVRKWTGC
jgi:bifunctional oligoribonuclease and PAP phosphatase NrnA